LDSFISFLRKHGKKNLIIWFLWLRP
jgi:hypothetical protein